MARLTLQRPGTALPKSSSTNAIRKEYALDVDTEPGDQLPMPSLIQHDLDDIYEPVMLPKIRSGGRTLDAQRLCVIFIYF